MKISKSLAGLGLAAGLAALASIPAHADPVTYLFTGLASGNINGTAFTNKLLDITASGDTSGSTSFSQAGTTGFTNEVGNMSVLLSGVTGAIGSSTDTYTVFDNQTNSVAGITNDTTYDSIDIAAPSFAGYDLTTDLGPVKATTSYLGFPIATSFGTITLSSLKTPTFTAIVTPAPVPEASSVVSLGLLLTLGLGGVVVAARKRKATAL